MSQNAKIEEIVAHELGELMVTCDPTDASQVSDLFEVKCGEHVFGFTDAQSLREFLIIHDEQAQNIEVRKSGEEDWCAFYEHPQIQRRKPQLVQKQSLEQLAQEQFWVLKEGQKTGPFSAEDLKELVESCDVLTTDLVSNDKGHHWLRLYEFEEFDRRNLTHHELPNTPQGKVFAESLRETRIALTSSDKQREEAEAIAGLAYIGNLRAGKGVEIERKKRRQERETEEIEDEQMSEISNGVDGAEKLKKNGQNQLAWYALFFLSLTGTLILLLTWNSGAPEQIQTAPDSQTAQAVPQNPAAQAQRQQQQAARTPGQKSPTTQSRIPVTIGKRQAIEAPQATGQPRVQQNSFRKSAAFQRAQTSPRVSGERQMEDDPYVDDYFYDDGSSTFESDPVRSQLSRDTIEPSIDNTWVEEMTEPEMYDTAVEEPPFEDLFQADPY